MKDSLSRVFNAGLQFATLSARFLFIFFIAKYLNVASVGYYGLFTSAIGYAMYFVGFDFYTYATREIIKTPITRRGGVLKSQMALSGFLYLILWPVAFLFLYKSNWPKNLVWWFLPILILEHFNQETSRFLIALSQPITASFILFVRQGSWAVASVALMTWDTPSRQLETVMVLWTIAGIIAAVVGIRKVLQMKMGGWNLAVDWVWIRRGIRISSSLLGATLALRGMQTVDRYWLEDLGGIEIVSAYVLLLSVAGTLMTFLDAGVFAYTYPNLIEMLHKNEHAAVRLIERQMLLQTIAISISYALFSWLTLPYLLYWISNPVYQSAQHWYPWLMAAMVVNAVSCVPHYCLYARRLDIHIIISHIGGLIVFIVSVCILRSTRGVDAVPLGLNIAFIFILVWKTAAYLVKCRWKIKGSSEFQSENSL